LSWWERIWAAVAAGFLVLAVPLTDEIGFVLSALFVAFHVWQSRKAARAVVT
jgi:hypothetical protein